MGHSFPVKEMNETHVDSVKFVESQSNLSRWPIKDYRLAIHDERSICLVVEGCPDSKTILGFAVAKIVWDGDFKTLGEAEIYNIAVDQNFRRKGIGGYLLRETTNLMNKQQIGKVWLEVRKSNKRAFSFYQEFGFDARYERSGYYSEPYENAVVMCLEIGRHQKTCQSP